jgi:hypothetical protein
LHNKPEVCGASVATAAGRFTTHTKKRDLSTKKLGVGVGERQYVCYRVGGGTKLTALKFSSQYPLVLLV